MNEYTFDFFSPEDLAIENASPKNEQYPFVIYELSLDQRPASWMSAWGISKGELNDQVVQIFANQFLTQVFSFETLKLTQHSFFKKEAIVLMNLPRRPVKYRKVDLQLYQAQQYATNVFSNVNYSDAKALGSNHIPILKPPFISGQRIPDNFSGIIQTPKFSVSLLNQDGRFDLTNFDQYFNVPANIKRADGQTQNTSDLKLIKRFYVDNVFISNDEIKITGKDIFNNFTKKINRFFNESTYVPFDNQNSNEPIPVAYGRINHIELIRLNDGKYIACDPKDNGLTKVFSVTDEKGVSKSFQIVSGLIQITNESADEKYFADIEGRSNLSAGAVIQDLYERTYSASVSNETWDLVELNEYKNISFNLNIVFDEHTLKSAIELVLKNDMAFLVQKNDGRLTIRRYGRPYQMHTISSKTLFKDFQKTYQNNQNYLTQVSIKYDFDFKKQAYNQRLNDYSKEVYLFEKYKKTKNMEDPIETHLSKQQDAQSLASLILNRFGTKKEIIHISVSKSLYKINLLDTININIVFTNRRVSNKIKWIVTGVDPAQDKLILEEI